MSEANQPSRRQLLGVAACVASPGLGTGAAIAWHHPLAGLAVAGVAYVLALVLMAFCRAAEGN